MNKKDNETERLEAEQSLYEHYWFDWYYGGRDRNAMIRWLKGNPHHVLEHHVDDLIQHLQNPTRRYLDGKQDPLQEFEKVRCMKILLNLPTCNTARKYLYWQRNIHTINLIKLAKL